MPEISVAIVEDNATARTGLKMLLDSSPGFRCLWAVGSAEEVLRWSSADTPDVVLMDINLPGKSGIECVWGLKERFPGTHVIMLTIEEDSQCVFQSLEAGASGYLVKDLPPEQILQAILEVQRGGAPMSSQIARLLVRSFHRRRPAPREQDNLTPREQQVLELVAKGYRTKEVAAELGIGVQTVETHLRNTYDKLHVRSRAAAVARYLRAAP
ncbi:MAG TPA: response regulator transcription factor [Verrucomicrobiota bacterium]|nr:response regulator transcription factor [Verrucomicrobiota bacterium]